MKETNYSPWHRWWLLFLLSVLGVVVYYVSGLFWKVHSADITYICHAITIAFFFFSIRTGYYTYKACKDNNTIEYYLANDLGWFVAYDFTEWGLLGTLIGLSYVFLFSGVDFTCAAGQAIVFRGIGTSLYTTITFPSCAGD